MLKISVYLSIVAVIFIFILNISNNNGQGDHIVLQSWAEKQIRLQLEPFQQNKFELQDIISTYNDLSSVKNNKILHFQIVDNKLYSNYSKSQDSAFNHSYEVFTAFFSKMLQRFPLNSNVDFLIDVSPQLVMGDKQVLLAPLIAASKNTSKFSEKFLILAPDYKTIDQLPKLYDNILKLNAEYPWERKLDKAIWRGAADEEYSRKYWELLPKIKLLKIASEHQDLLDAKFDAVSDNNIALKDQLAKQYPFAVLTSEQDAAKYKISIIVENGSAVYPDFLWHLLSNSIPLKTKSSNVMWFYSILKEGEDYISIAQDTSDVLEKIEWVRSHDREAKTLAEQSSNKIRKEITPAHLMLYWHKLLETYAKAQKLELNKPTLLPVSVEKGN